MTEHKYIDSYSRVALQRIHRYNVLFPRSRFHVMEKTRSGYNVLSLQLTFFRLPWVYVITRLDCIHYSPHLMKCRRFSPCLVLAPSSPSLSDRHPWMCRSPLLSKLNEWKSFRVQIRSRFNRDIPWRGAHYLEGRHISKKQRLKLYKNI